MLIYAVNPENLLKSSVIPLLRDCAIISSGKVGGRAKKWVKYAPKLNHTPPFN